MAVPSFAIGTSQHGRHRKPLSTAQSAVCTLAATVSLLLSIATLIGFFGLWFVLRTSAALDYADFSFPPGLLLLLLPVLFFAGLSWLLLRIILNNEHTHTSTTGSEPATDPLTPFEELLATQN